MLGSRVRPIPSPPHVPVRSGASPELPANASRHKTTKLKEPRQALSHLADMELRADAKLNSWPPICSLPNSDEYAILK